MPAAHGDDPRMVKGPDGVPVHLLWDDCSPILTDGVKTQKKQEEGGLGTEVRGGGGCIR